MVMFDTLQEGMALKSACREAALSGLPETSNSCIDPTDFLS